MNAAFDLVTLAPRAARVAFFVAAVAAFVMAALPHPPRIPGEPPDKILHIAAFATLGMLAAIGFRKRSVIWLLSALTGFGAAIELVQAVPALNRSSELSDLLADAGAAAVSLAITRWLLNRHTRTTPPAV